MTMPYVIGNGPGNWPDADKLMANYDYLENGVTGRTSFKNRIINGDMRIDQRKEGGAVSVNSTSNFYSVDRWFGSGQSADGVFSLERSTTAPVGFSHSLKATVTTADASIGATQVYFIQQSIEGSNIVDFGMGTSLGKYMTLSFYVRSSITGQFGGVISNSAQNRSYKFSFTINAADTFEYKTITIPCDTTGTWLTTTGIGIKVLFSLGAGTSFAGTGGVWGADNLYVPTGSTNLISTNGATLYLSGVQLELNPVATPFETIPISESLSLCERYFQKSFPIGTAVAQNSGVYRGAVCYVVQTAGAGPLPSQVVSFKKRMRTNPTFTFYSPGAATSKYYNRSASLESGIAQIPYAEPSEVGFTVFNTQIASDALNTSVYVHWSADAEI